MVTEGFSLDEVRANMRLLSSCPHVSYKPAGSEHFEPLHYISACMLVGLGNDTSPLSLYNSKSGSTDNHITRMLDDELLTLADNRIRVSDKASNAGYIFHSKVRASR